MSNRLPGRASTLFATALLLTACSDEAADDPCRGPDAPNLGCLCLSADECPGRTGVRLTLEAEGLTAPGDFDALSIHVAGDKFAAQTRRVDMGGKQAPSLPLELLLFAESPKGTELDIQASTFICRSRADQPALSAAELKSCTGVVQRLTGSSGRAPKTVKLPKENKVKEVTLTLKAVEGF